MFQQNERGEKYKELRRRKIKNKKKDKNYEKKLKAQSCTFEDDRAARFNGGGGGGAFLPIRDTGGGGGFLADPDWDCADIVDRLDDEFTLDVILPDPTEFTGEVDKCSLYCRSGLQLLLF